MLAVSASCDLALAFSSGTRRQPVARYRRVDLVANASTQRVCLSSQSTYRAFIVQPSASVSDDLWDTSCRLFEARLSN